MNLVLHKRKRLPIVILAVAILFSCTQFVLATTTFILPTNGIEAYTVELQATISESPVSITLEWPYQPGVTNYTIYRKNKGDISWGNIIGTIPYNASATTYTYTDTNIVVGTGYEYKVVKNMPTTPTVAYGYIYAGIKLPIVEHRGTIILVIDSTYQSSLTSEINQLKDDLVGDGWSIITHNVGRSDSVTSVKALIKGDYDADPTNVKSVLLLGHVPVPYSGRINPDNHSDHLGAWPADVYYGEMTSPWTDDVTWPNSVLSRNTNIAHDGKFDQSYPPSEVELQVGRIDLSDMPAFLPKTEVDLLRQYLVKDHQFKHKLIIPIARAMMVDNFANSTGEALAMGGWKNFSDIVGSANIATTSNYFNTLNSNSYEWTYAAGGGSFTGMSGFGSTSNYVTNNPQTIFNLLFGSYFGDWDSTDNLLRAPLASAGWGLASVWSGRPQWHMYHMALGDNIGYATKIAQDNINLWPSLPFVQASEGTTHIALMGDPSLRALVVAPVSNVVATNATSNNVDISWNASLDSGLSGYHIYRATNQYGLYTRVTNTPVVGTTYTDTVPFSGGTFYYIVRAVKLETTPSGSYYNQSEGIITNLSITPINQAPVISSLSPITVVLPNNASVAAVVNDDSLPSSTVSLSWTKISGPGTVSFGSPSSASTSMTFSTTGSYVVQISADDGVLQSQSQVTITVVNDTVAPSIPTGLTASPSENTIFLTWIPSTDIVGVVGYKIYRDGILIGTSTSPLYQDTGLTLSTSYSYTLSAYDQVPNTSSQSTPYIISTTAHIVSSGGGGGGFIHPTLPVSNTSIPIINHPTSVTEKNTKPIFTKTLKVGIKDPQVKQLQQYLNKSGYSIATKGPGSPGKETTIFGPATKNALMRLEKDLKAKIGKKIKVDGILDTEVRKVINEI